jgi:P4 family phage/plasmid primase-like protien
MPLTKLDLFLNGDPDSASETKKAGFKVTDKSPFNLWSFDNREKWNVPEDHMDEFRKLYCADLKNSVPRYLTEKNTVVGQLRIDLDIKFDGRVDEHKHTQDQILKFIQIYMAEIKKYLVINDNVEIYVLEKDSPTFDQVKKISSSGVHIQVPALKTRAGVEQATRRSILHQRKMEECFEGLEFRGTWDDVYDKQPLTHTNNWTLLGSKKKDGMPYQIRYVVDWDYQTGEVSTEEYTSVPVTPDLMKLLSVRSPTNEETPMTEFGQQNIHVQAEREVVQISGGRATSAGRGRQAVRGEEAPSRGSSPGRNYVPPLTEAMLKYYESHTNNLAEFRYTSYGDWINVGQCLKNIHPDLVDLWFDFSSKIGDTYNQREALNKWNSFGFRMDGPKLSVNSLRNWSRTDNLTGFLEAEKLNIDRLIEESAMTATENDVAHVVSAMFGDEFKCARYGTNSWYQFIGNGWRETDGGIALRCRLSQDVAKIYLEKEMAEFVTIRNLGTCEHKQPDPECAVCNAESRKKSFSNMRLKLKKTNFKSDVMKECRELFLDETFATKLDENKNLIGFNNGVFDTMTMEFRQGQPEDYVSFSTKLDYDPNKPHTAFECWSEIDKFMREVLPDQAVRNYFIHHLSTCLSGGNEAQKFHILTGSGSNGKSMLMNLMSTAMGDYTCKAPISLLTQGRNKSAAAAPELVRMKGRRFVTMQEPDEEVPLNTGLMKELASCEKITCRDLYQGSKQMIDFDIQARFHLACNEKPKINATDGGTWRRLCVVGFTSKFVAEPKLPNEKPIDESLVAKMVSTEWATCFLSYLVSVYKEGNGWRKIVPPTKVMEYTNEYQEESDVIARFIREFVHPLQPGVEPENVTTGQMNRQLKEWKQNNEIFKGSPAELKKRMETVYGKHPPTGWTSFRFGPA